MGFSKYWTKKCKITLLACCVIAWPCIVKQSQNHFYPPSLDLFCSGVMSIFHLSGTFWHLWESTLLCLFLALFLSADEKWHRKSTMLSYTFLFRVPFKINIILKVTASAQQAQLQKFPEGADPGQPTATFWWRWETSFCIQGSLYDHLHLLTVLVQFSFWDKKLSPYSTVHAINSSHGYDFTSYAVLRHVEVEYWCETWHTVSVIPIVSATQCTMTDTVSVIHSAPWRSVSATCYCCTSIFPFNAVQNSTWSSIIPMGATYSKY